MADAFAAAMNTMNPVDLYHDPSLDDLYFPGNRHPHLASGPERRRAGTQAGPHNGSPPWPERSQHSPEVPRGPPMAYRSSAPASGPRRSFSQRAKARPYAQEAFADDDYDTHDQTPTVRSPIPARPDTMMAEAIGTASSSSGSTTAAAARAHRPETVARSDGPSHGHAHYSNNARLRPRRPPEATNHALPEARRYASPEAQSGPAPVPVPGPTSTSRRPPRHSLPSEQKRRDWAPDRSPLQKLEVKLNDISNISKEEKRARVQAAEIRLRESKTNRAVSAQAGPRRHQQGPIAPAKPSPSVDRPRAEDAGLVRNLGATQGNHGPDPRRLSAERSLGNSGFEYSGSSARDRRVDSASEPRFANTTRDPATQRSHEPTARAGGTNGSQSARYADLAVGVAKGSESASSQPGGTGLAISVGRPAPRQIHQPGSLYTDGSGENAAGLVERQRNASHKATLAKLTGAAPVVATAVASHSAPREQPTSQTPEADYSQQRPRGISVSPHLQTERGELTPASPPIAGEHQTRQKGRRPSVTFQEPADRVYADEWKHAKTARLCLADLALDKANDNASQNQAWWESGPDSTKSRRRARAGASFGLVGDPIDDRTAEFSPPLFLRCGPLLRFTGIKTASSPSPTSGPPPGHGTSTLEPQIWRGSVMIVTQDSRSSYQQPPVLRLFSRPKSLLPPPPALVTEAELAPEYIDPIAGLEKVSRTGRALYVRPVDHLEEGKDLSNVETDDGLFESSPSLLATSDNQAITATAHNRRTSNLDGEHVGRYQEVPGARLYADPSRDVTFWRFNIEVELADTQQHIAYRINRGASSSFWVPARGEAMNIAFHSCNGFSTSINPDLFSGPDPLWRDVLNVHQTRPFHVMIGGGDQIYNDCVKSDTVHFARWIQIRNPHQKHNAPFTAEMQAELETFYLNRYALCFSQGLFGMAASQIPMVNIWDDHDIIDGFGSYPDHFMRSPVFTGLGNIAFKYYMLFQHQSVPEETPATEPSWVLGHEPGPYIHQLSRSLFMHLGSRVAFLGIDCRTERMRDEIMSVRSFDILLERCRKEIIEGDTKHLIVLLGVPIAYPRLVWLENVLTSRAMDPVKALGRAGILKTSFLNNFDGGIEILDDLDDHWTASHHKSERYDLITDLQDLAAEKSVRITILGGDVHLAAVGQFYSNPKLKIPKDKDHRYMPNVISSAIVNAPPPNMLADVINKRNKIHHLNAYTHEDMIPIFTHDVDHKKRNNTHLLPRRNWCSIREYSPGATPPSSLPTTPSAPSDEDLESQQSDKPAFSLSKQPGGLLRRLSGRKAPPSSYPEMMDTPQLRSASYDGSQPGRGNFFGLGRSDSRSKRPSLDSDQPQRRAASFDNSTSRPPSRPGVLRRPTNLSAKAAKKGNVPAIDADGNEMDLNDHINLEGGLDIVINAEVDQKDPAGITVPYRLLVPALWYDGSSDREKLESGVGVARRSSLLERVGLGHYRSQKLAQSQGAGNWGQEMSDSESISETDEGVPKQASKPRFSFFGGRRRKQDGAYSDQEHDIDESRTSYNKQELQQQHLAQAKADQTQEQLGASQHTSKVVQRAYETGQLQAPNQNDTLYDTTNRPPPQHFAQTTRQTSKVVQRGYDIAHLQPSVTAQAPAAQNDRLYDTIDRPPLQHLPQPARPGRRSLTITSFIDREHAPAHSPGEVNAFNAPPRGQPGAVTTSASVSAAVPQRTLSKQERVLGLGAGDYRPSTGDGTRAVSDSLPRGYSGIEAYREPSKLKRNLSLKKAKNWLDGRRTSRDYDSDRWDDAQQTFGTSAAVNSTTAVGSFTTSTTAEATTSSSSEESSTTEEATSTSSDESSSSSTTESSSSASATFSGAAVSNKDLGRAALAVGALALLL
ncbi:hypothetical protein DV738_g5655, partial [Chaetothyriales sp. CBS 135597]